MKIENKALLRWSLAAISVAMAGILAACGSVTPMPAEAPFRMDAGAVEVQDEHHTWVPVAGETTFELAGKLESTNPWMVTGNTFAVRNSTQVSEGLKAGDLVKVKGVILQDATWLAETIEPSEEKIDPAITLLGPVNSSDPWTVGGISLKVTGDTVIDDKLAPDMIARVEILLLADGHWDIVSLTALSNFTEVPGCATVTATVAGVNAQEVRFAGWPAIPLDPNVTIENEAGNAASLSEGRRVLVVICPAQGGRSQITKIIVLWKNDDGSAGGARTVICHKPDKQGGHTLSVPAAALPAHLRHGDTLGPCPPR